MGIVSNDKFRSRFTICRWLPNPMVFSPISFLNPVTTATAIIITAKLSAIAMVAIFINGRERFLFPSFPLTRRCAIKCSSFNVYYKVLSSSIFTKIDFTEKTCYCQTSNYKFITKLRFFFNLFSAEIGRNFSPDLSFPFQQRITPSVCFQPFFSPFDKFKENSVS